MKKIGKHIILAFFCFANAITFAQEGVSFTSKVSKSKLGVNERLRVEFTMNKDGDNFTPPSFEGFRVIGGPNQSVRYEWDSNGKRIFIKTYSYFLAPTKKGKFAIKQATIEIDGKTYKTTPIQVQVTAAVDNPNQGPTTDDIASENLHLIAEVSNTKPYLNEAVSVIYKLYVSRNISVSNYTPNSSPKYNNFWSQEIDIPRPKIEQTIYKGEPYYMVTLKKVVLYPQTSGKLEIEPLSLDVDLEVPTNRRDFWGGVIMKPLRKTISAGKRVLDIKALPEAGKPDNFSGAVGEFNFRVTTSKKALKATESLQAKVEISGKGNLKLLERPKLTLPGSLEVYDPEYKQSISTNLSGMQGKVWDNYTVVPQYKGKYPIPSIAFSFFNPKTKRYETLQSEEIIIDVYEGPTAASATNTAPTLSNKQAVVVAGEQFKFLKLKPNLVSMNQPPFFGSKSYYLWLLMPLLLIPIAIIVGKQRSKKVADVEGNKRRKANRLARKYLSEAKKKIGDKEAFYDALERALHNYLKASLRIETSEFTKEKIYNLLVSKNVEEETATRFVSLLKNCEAARYSPSSAVVMQEDYEKSSQVISLIDKHM
jgi:hypothetical protein